MKAQIAWLVALLAAIPIPAGAQHRTFDLREQTEEAEVIVVGGVISVRETGTTEVTIAGHTLPAKVLEAKVQVDRTLKGANVPVQAAVRFALPISPAGSVGYVGIAYPDYRIFLLKRAGDHFELANPYTPSLPAMPQASASSSSDVLTAVVNELASVIESPHTPEIVKLGVAFRLGSTSSAAATEVLVRQLPTSNPALRAGVADALLQHNYVPALAVAQELLMNSPATVPRYLLVNLSSAIGRYVKDERAIPSLHALLKAPDASSRRAAALALRNTASRQALEALASALRDGDPEVRYYAVIGLAEITGQPEWRPLEEDFHADQARYLSHWLQWAEEHDR
ncbi:MAG TPA: HEAT repeat domain-containing protein [Terriglobales bacterium]|nr:HEAT repeat domain-containing protein [Terriglobales bacterium]